jgi:hypothetical protein
VRNGKELSSATVACFSGFDSSFDSSEMRLDLSCTIAAMLNYHDGFHDDCHDHDAAVQHSLALLFSIKYA